MSRNTQAIHTPFSDLVSLGKPNITLMSVLMAAGGMAISPHSIPPWLYMTALGGVALTVSSANAFNMVLERTTDALMTRTADRPLPGGRMSPNTATIFAGVSGAIGLGILATAVNLLTAGLALGALAAYVLIYTPLKRVTPLALLIGAVPGAVPPLLGWTAATGSINVPGVTMFAIVLLWQMPHFLAIGLSRKSEYLRAGIRILPVVRGDVVAKRQAVAYATALIPVSWMLAIAGPAGSVYLAVATVAGTIYLGMGVRGLFGSPPVGWARNFFLVSLTYLPLVCLGIAADLWLQ